MLALVEEQRAVMFLVLFGRSDSKTPPRTAVTHLFDPSREVLKVVDLLDAMRNIARGPVVKRAGAPFGPIEV